MGAFLKRNKKNIIVLLIILLVGSFNISKKEGYHMDELLSFELANAEFTPWIVTTQPVGRLEKFVQNEIYADSFGETLANIADTVKDVLKNRGESKLLSYKADVYEEPVWISAEQFKNYITTEGRDRFNYLSVYFNVKDDNHPPLHFMALHTVSSLFPGKVYPWMGCIINLFFMAGICILLIKICREFLEDEELGRAACILYACSMAGIASLLLIRMYTMLTFFCMAALYLHIKKMRTGQWETQNKTLIFVTVCGFLTQYFFVIFMLFLAGTTMVMIRKKYGVKPLWYYIRTMGLSGVIGVCIFPFSVADVLYSGRGVESVQNLTGGFSDIGERFLRFLTILTEEFSGGTIGGGIFLLVIAAALAARLWEKYRKTPERTAVSGMDQEDDFSATVWMAGIPLIGYFFVVVKIAPFYADRYMMPVFPVIALFMGMILKKSLKFLGAYRSAFRKNGLLTVLAVLIVLPGIVTASPEYRYSGYGRQVKKSEEYSDLSCLCIYDGVGYYENLIEFTNYKKTLMVTQKELLNRSPDKVLKEEDRLIVIYKYSADNIDPFTVQRYLEEQYGYRFSKFMMRGTVHGDMIVIYEKEKV